MSIMHERELKKLQRIEHIVVILHKKLTWSAHYLHRTSLRLHLNRKLFHWEPIYPGNTQIYNLISVLQFTQLYLRDAIISSKTDAHNGSKKENMVKLKIIIW